MPVKNENSSQSSNDVFVVTPDPQLLQEYLKNLKSDESSTVKVEKREETTTQAITTTKTTTATTSSVIATTTLVETTTEEEDDEEYAEIDIDDGLKPSCIAALCANG